MPVTGVNGPLNHAGAFGIADHPVRHPDFLKRKVQGRIGPPGAHHDKRSGRNDGQALAGVAALD